MSAVPTPLPALRLDAAGNRHIDHRALFAIAAPLILNSLVQAGLNLTDTWFIGRISTEATAAIGAIYWLVLVLMFALSGVGMAVQPLVAQYYGARRLRHASRATWTGVWAILLLLPLFLLFAFSGKQILSPFGLDARIESLALEYWLPRLLGGPLAAMLWAVDGFFNGIGRTRITLAITVLVLVSNAILNQLFMFELGMGIAGAAWATSCAQLLGVSLAFLLFLRLDPRRYQQRYTWRPRLALIRRQFALGVPMALGGVADIGAFALFSLMMVRISAVDGATTQIVIMLTSLAFMPGFGIALAGTTVVGQAIGAGDRDWAARLGSRVILIVVGVMGGMGLATAIAGPVLLPWFVNDTDPNAAAVIALGTTLLWIAACYQFFDAMNFSSALCLRGAGDTTLPGLLVFGLAFTLFLPLTHVLAFAPGQGWIDALPGYGLGAIGGWVALLIYVTAIGLTLITRWRLGSWRRLALI